MSLDWYVFEESYLLHLDYKVCDCKIIIFIDAKISNQHPKVNKIKSYEDTFEEIQLVFNGVNYYRGINSTNILNDPNDDIGNVYSINIGDSDLIEDGIGFKYIEGLMKISMENNNEVIAEMFSKCNGIRFIEFLSDMIAFRAVFTDYEIKVKQS